MKMASDSTLSLRLITFNIRYAAHPHKRSPNEAPWPERLPLLISQLTSLTTFHPSTIICLQEALDSQLTSIQSALGPPWTHIGRGRDDGKTKGEYSPIFYRKDVWTCERSETRWLSETPQKPSRGWDASLPRIATVGVFVHRDGGKVVVMSTHFDHLGVVARKESARLLVAWSKEFTHQDPTLDAVVVAGDLNSTPEEDAYRVMAQGPGMLDTAEGHEGEMTYTGFGEKGDVPKRIDFVFLHKGERARVGGYEVKENQVDGVYVSDHRAVVVDIEVWRAGR